MIKESDVRVVLVRPRNPLNIGAAARAMANFGFSDLVVVKPYPPAWRETVSAVGAEKLVRDARLAHSLEEAVGDCHLVLGTTVLRNRRVVRPVARLPDLAAVLKERIAPGFKMALLFGPEKTGLSGPYLERCHLWLTIPTHGRQPSMNLGQAVAVCCYELSRARTDLGPRAQQPPRATLRETRALVKQTLGLFDATGYLSFLSKRDRARKVWRTFLQWDLRRADLALLHGIMRFVARRLKNSGRET